MRDKESVVTTSSSPAQRVDTGRVDALRQQIRRLVRTHHRSLLEQIDRLGEMLAAPEAHCAGAIVEAEFLAHQIKGAGGSLGFSDVNRAATLVDNHLKSLMAQGADAAAAQVARGRALFAELRRTARATTPESSSLWNMKPAGLPPVPSTSA